MNKTIEEYSTLKEGDSLYIVKNKRIFKHTIYKIEQPLRGIKVFTHDNSGDKHVYRFYSHVDPYVIVDSLCNKIEFSTCSEGPWEERSGRIFHHWNTCAAFDNIIDAENYRNQ